MTRFKDEGERACNKVRKFYTGTKFKQFHCFKDDSYPNKNNWQQNSGEEYNHQFIICQTLDRLVNVSYTLTSFPTCCIPLCLKFF